MNYTCPEGCLGRGNCSDEGRCECGEGWRGEWCQVPTCPNDCFGNGVCAGDYCQCNSQYTGQCKYTDHIYTPINHVTTMEVSTCTVLEYLHVHVLYMYVHVYPSRTVHACPHCVHVTNILGTDVCVCVCVRVCRCRLLHSFVFPSLGGHQLYHNW